MSVPSKNHIDEKISKLIQEGKLEDITEASYYSEQLGFNIINRWSPLYWGKAIGFLSSEDIEYILSFDQEGNWNGILYEQAKIELQNRIDRLFLNES